MDGLPFQPEMFAYCGRRMRVAKTAHKTCDSTPHRTGGRRMYDAVHLEGARCDGACMTAARPTASSSGRKPG